MKNFGVIVLILSVASFPGLLNAQSACVADAQTGNQTVLAISGGQQLTQIQADCALELIDFMAAVTRGVDLIQVDEPMRQMWRAYLVAAHVNASTPRAIARRSARCCVRIRTSDSLFQV